MNYTKPEIMVLGDASLVIQGTGVHKTDVGPGLISADCELDD